VERIERVEVEEMTDGRDGEGEGLKVQKGSCKYLRRHWAAMLAEAERGEHELR
jgi:hypothetical protein